MKNPLPWLICVLLILSVTIISWKPGTGKTKNDLTTNISAKAILGNYVSTIYDAAHLQESGMALSVFKKAITGFINLKIDNKLSPNASILTVVDYAKSSCEKRMWIIDVINKQLLLNTWVAHGQGSGEDMACHFSDRLESHQSSLGFYLTDDVYFGKNGRSLRLDGVDDGFNTNARTRAIVVHAADYVCEDMILQNGRLGRSFGCPAVSPVVADFVINTIKDKTVMYINGNDDNYTSKYLDEDLAAAYVSQDPANGVVANL